jgi:phosphoglycolate phosphatase-like HAD superfamily hydrolase
VYKNIIWDVDGTLFDTYPSIALAFRSALNDLGKDAPLDWIEDQARVSLNYCLASIAQRVALTEADISDAFADQYDRVLPQDQPPFPGVIEICKTITSRGGMNLIITHRGKEGTDQLLAAHNMTSLFTDCFAREAGYPKKPDPTAFLAMIHKYALVREETLAVGDRDIDVQAGQAAGLFSCLFTTKASAIKPDLIFQKYDDLLMLLSKP